MLRTLLASFFAVTSLFAFADEPLLRDIVDAEMQKGWSEQKLSPAVVSTDAEFLRRIYLDLTGVIPKFDEATAFLDDPSADKRAKLIEQLLADPRFAKHQADLWDVILFTRNPPGFDADKREGIQRWLRKQFEENKPYDEMVRALLKAEGNSIDEGPATYYVQYRNQPEDMNEAVSQTFLGVQLQCARCHDHPFETWKQVDFYGMAAFLSRVQIVSVGKKDNLTKYVVAEKNTGDILFTGSVKEQMVGKKGDPVKPKFLLGGPLEEPPLPEGYKEVKFEENKEPAKPMFSRKDQLADWITRPENPYFAKAIANRLWAQFLGRGIVHPIDNLSEANEPSHPKLLETLAQALIAKKFDLRWYIRELVSSRTYQLSSRGEGGEPMPKYHEYARHRPLTAEELADAWRVGTWYNDTDQGKGKEGTGSRFHPLGRDYMLRYFGTPNTGAGDFQGGLQEHLFLNNGPLGSVINGGKGSLGDWLQTSKDGNEVKIERLFLSLLSRRPTAEEAERLTEFLQTDDKNKQPRWSEATWVLMTSSEFRFNH